MMMQHAITRDGVSELAKLIHDWQKLFLSIHEYQGLFKPKGHFYSHYPTDILKFGPTRLSFPQPHLPFSRSLPSHLPFTPLLTLDQAVLVHAL